MFYPSIFLTPRNARLAVAAVAGVLLSGCGAFYPKAKEPLPEGTSSDQEQTAINAWDSLASKAYSTGGEFSLAPLAATVKVTPTAEIKSKTSIMYRLQLPMAVTLADGNTATFFAAAEFKLKGKLDLTFSATDSFKKEGDCRYDLKRALGKCALTSSKKKNAWQVGQPYTIALALLNAGSDAAPKWQVQAKVSDAAGKEIASSASPVKALDGVKTMAFTGALNAAIVTYKPYDDCAAVPLSSFSLITPTMQMDGGETTLKPGKASVHGMCKVATEGKAVQCTNDSCTLAIRP